MKKRKTGAAVSATKASTSARSTKKTVKSTGRKAAAKSASKRVVKAAKAVSKKKTATKTASKKKAVKKTTARAASKKKAVKKAVPGKKTTARAVKKKSVTRKAAPKKAAVKTTVSRRTASGGLKESAKPHVTRKIRAAEKRALRKMLLEMREHFSEQIEYLKKNSLERHDADNSFEDGTDAFDRQFALTIAGSEQESLAAIDHALRRLDEGDYGFCESCGERISIPRLKVLPFVKMCIKCKSKAENGRRRKLLL